MNRMALAVLSSLTLLSSAACSSSAPAAPNSTSQHETAKVSAPVAVKADLQGDQARVTVRFDAAATGVKINVHGADGLVVKSAATPVDNSNFTQGSETTFDVAFTPGTGRSHLVVAVDGTFKGSHRTSVSSFAIGTPSPEQQRASGTAVTGDDGQRVKIMPANGADTQ
ncbi:hypothetical protein [Hyalangium gracile]|uniref:hypothetical protein n=1 Tax=Hyalangium gracile TaxID=394092 RepID=UPI001CCECB69|nr:hypothetical protein [Hyalangium gracile]